MTDIVDSHNATKVTTDLDAVINYGVLFAYSGTKNLVVDRKCITWMTTVRDTLIIFDIVNKALRGDYDVRRHKAKLDNDRQYRLLNMTANYGGDSSIFWHNKNWSGHINELDSTIHQGLIHNCNEYGALDRWSVNNVDSIKFIRETQEKFDVIYADPPFGDAYEEDYCDNLYIGDLDMNQIVEYLFVGNGLRLWRTQKRIAVFKLPYKRYNVQGFVEGLRDLEINNTIRFKMWSPAEMEQIDNKTHKVILVLIMNK
jgi:hypothetical protein